MRRKFFTFTNMTTIESIEAWLLEDATLSRFDDCDIYRICTNEAERDYNNPVLDPEVKDGCLRFSYCIARQQFCYNCLLRTDNGDDNTMVLKVVTTDRHCPIHMEFRDVRSTEDVFEILTDHVYHLRWSWDDQGRRWCEDLRFPERGPELAWPSARGR